MTEAALQVGFILVGLILGYNYMDWMWRRKQQRQHDDWVKRIAARLPKKDAKK